MWLVARGPRALLVLVSCCVSGFVAVLAAFLLGGVSLAHAGLRDALGLGLTAALCGTVVMVPLSLFVPEDKASSITFLVLSNTLVVLLGLLLVVAWVKNLGG